MLILYMMVYSISLGPVTWLYVPEIMPARIVPLATMMNWFGCSLCVILTPMVIEATGGNPYVAFFSFAAISIVFGVLNAVWVVETKDCTGEQIAKKFLPKA
jgi:membrane protein implicated in regulation of membrane protease activity